MNKSQFQRCPEWLVTWHLQFRWLAQNSRPEWPWNNMANFKLRSFYRGAPVPLATANEMNGNASRFLLNLLVLNYHFIASIRRTQKSSSKILRICWIWWLSWKSRTFLSSRTPERQKRLWRSSDRMLNWLAKTCVYLCALELHQNVFFSFNYTSR